MLVDDLHKPLIIKAFCDWDLILHENQICPGRCTAWYRGRSEHDGEGLPVDLLSPRAWLEIQDIFRELRCKAYRKLGYKVDNYGTDFLINTQYLANLVGAHKAHMHVHFIPRFREPVTIPLIDIAFKDPAWGKSYEGLPKFDLAMDKMLAIRQIMALALSQ